MDCWICGGDTANSREHAFKRSDIKGYFGLISQGRPLFRQILDDNMRLNDPIISIKSDKLTFEHLICSKCNNERTQPYDYSWEILSEYLQSNWSKILRNRYIYLSKVFPNNTKSHALHVHLYFVKLFGFSVLDEGIPINISNFSEALLSSRPHNNVFLTFTNAPESNINFLHNSDINYIKDAFNLVHTAAWVYTLYPVSVRVAYLSLVSPPEYRLRAWHPRQPGRQINIGKYYLGS